nr:hypothetical protein [Tanacetum cinerariifolium]GFA88273.1 hypothetical protein [Tanacetum cinerariifolium]
LVRNVDSPSKFYMYLRFLQLMINAQIANLSSHNTKYTSPALIQKQVHDDVDDAADDEDVANEISVKPTPPSPTPDKIAQAIKITKLKQRVKRLEKKRKLKASGFKRLRKVGTTQRVESSANTIMDDQEDRRLPESQAQVYHLDLEHAQKVLSMQVEEVIEVVIAAKLMIEVVTIAAATTVAIPITAATTITDALVPKASAPRRRRGVIIQDPKEVTTTSEFVQSEVKFKDKGKGILVEEPKPLKRQAQIEHDEAFARELEVELNANINWNEVIQ